MPAIAEPDLSLFLDILLKDVRQAAREIARRKGLTLGQMVSALARRAPTRRVESDARHGVPRFPKRPDGAIVTLEIINELRDQAP